MYSTCLFCKNSLGANEVIEHFPVGRRLAFDAAKGRLLGSVYPFDPQLRFPAFVDWVIRRSVRPGSIIILHDGNYKGRNTTKTLRRVLPELARRGYRVVTLSELTASPSARAR